MKIDNFARFYALLNKIEHYNKEELKRQLVHQYTKGRTESLREMDYTDYNKMCNALQVQIDGTYGLREKRSIVLKLMQKCGVDTTSWTRINALCKDVRIAGKEFRRMNIDDLEELAVKLRMIERKGGFKAINMELAEKAHPRKKKVYIYMPVSGRDTEFTN